MAGSLGGRYLTPPPSPYLGSPDSVMAVADQQLASAGNYINQLALLTASLTPPVINPEFPTGGSAPAVELPDAPAAEYPVWVSPGIPEAFSGTLDISDLTVEPFDVDPPTIVYGAAPAAFSGVMPDAPAVNLTFADPTLSVSLPAAPALLSLNIAPFGGMTMPTFSADEPTLSIVEPTIREYVPGTTYTSALLTALQTSLLERITTGGTGLAPDVENALWERGREREAKTYQDQVRELERMERLGMRLPPGTYLDARLRLMTERDAQDRGHSREVMVKAAELELDNVKHALTTANALETRLIDHTNNVEQRLFESTRYATEAGISIYNAKVEQYRALVQVYQTKVNIYEAQVRAETAKVEAYRAQVEAEKAKADVNTALVRQYEVQVNAALSNIEIYKAEIAGIQAKADIERTKIMVFGEQVRGFAAQVNAYTAGVEGYRATLEGEKTKAQVYSAQVDAFSARVNANARQVESRVSVYRGQIEAKTVEWDGYKAQSSAEAARVQAHAAVTGSAAEIYRSTITGYSAYHETLTKQWQATLDQNQQTARIGIEASKANSDSYITVRSLALDAAKVGATVSAQLGAAALNAVNWSSSISTGTSISDSYGESYSESDSRSTSTADSFSENHNYNYSV